MESTQKPKLSNKSSSPSSRSNDYTAPTMSANSSYSSQDDGADLSVEKFDWMKTATRFLREAFPSFNEEKVKHAGLLAVAAMKRRPLYTALGAVGVGILLGIIVSRKSDEIEDV